MSTFRGLMRQGSTNAWIFNNQKYRLKEPHLRDTGISEDFLVMLQLKDGGEKLNTRLLSNY